MCHDCKLNATKQKIKEKKYFIIKQKLMHKKYLFKSYLQSIHCAEYTSTNMGKN